jgi:tRNA threonylcarbamoyl adenosine modification protein (Sua5/YciO/YrdC/YwlC family)
MQHYEIDRWHIRPDIIRDVAQHLRDGDTVLVPTDSTWAIICDAEQKASVERIRELREKIANEQERLEKVENRPLSLICGSLSQVGQFTLLDQPQFRLIRRLFPGPYTLILPVSLKVPRTLHTSRKVIGIRMPDHDVTKAIMDEFGAPVFATTARTPDGSLLSSTAEVEGMLSNYIDVVTECEPIVPEPSTVIDATAEPPVVLRAGKGDLEDYWIMQES